MENKEQSAILELTKAVKQLTEEVRHLTRAVEAIPAIRIQVNRGGNNQMGDNNAMNLEQNRAKHP